MTEADTHNSPIQACVSLCGLQAEQHNCFLFGHVSSLALLVWVAQYVKDVLLPSLSEGGENHCILYSVTFLGKKLTKKKLFSLFSR